MRHNHKQRVQAQKIRHIVIESDDGHKSEVHHHKKRDVHEHHACAYSVRHFLKKMKVCTVCEVMICIKVRHIIIKIEDVHSK